MIQKFDDVVEFDLNSFSSTHSNEHCNTSQETAQPGTQSFAAAPAGFTVRKARFAPSDAARSPYLGNTTKFASEFSVTKRSRQAERYYLQSLARELLPGERVSLCLRSIAPGKHHVDVMHAEAEKRAYFQNLMVCARVWQCPVCAAKITEQRRQELAFGVAASGKYPVLVTFTLRHRAGDLLADLLAALIESHRALKSGELWQNIASEFFWYGSIRALEVTHGRNGWHPHMHELVLLDQKPTPAHLHGLQRALRERWEKMLQRRGFDASWRRGVVVEQEEQKVLDYITKFGREPVNTGWTAVHEVTKAPVKKSNAGGRTPFQLLADYGAGDLRAGRLFVEYSETFKGRKHLFWSRGLKGELGIAAVDDGTLAAAEPDDVARLLARLSPVEWKAVLYPDRRGELLDIARDGDVDKLQDWLSELI